jgi:hypothetical protein
MRPLDFHLDTSHWLAKQLRFAGLGCMARGHYYRDSSPYRVRVTANSLTSADKWVYLPDLHRFGFLFGSSTERYLEAALALSGTECTLSMWIRYDSEESTFGAIAASADDNSTAGTFQVETDYIRGSSIGWTLGENVFDSTIKHLCITFEASSQKLYVDSTLHSSSNAFQLPLFSNLQLGINRSQSIWADGILVDVMLHSRILGSYEISEIADPTNYMLGGLIADDEPAIPMSLFGGGAEAADVRGAVANGAVMDGSFISRGVMA